MDYSYTLKATWTLNDNVRLGDVQELKELIKHHTNHLDSPDLSVWASLSAPCIDETMNTVTLIFHSFDECDPFEDTSLIYRVLHEQIQHQWLSLFQSHTIQSLDILISPGWLWYQDTDDAHQELARSLDHGLFPRGAFHYQCEKDWALQTLYFQTMKVDAHETF